MASNSTALRGQGRAGSIPASGMIPAMEVTDRPLFALIPVLAAALAVLVVAIFRGSEDAVAVLFPSFLTILPLLRASRNASYLAAGLLALIGSAEYAFGGLFLLPAAALLAWVGRALDQ